MTTIVIFAADLAALAALSDDDSNLRWVTDKEDVAAGFPDYGLAEDQGIDGRVAVMEQQGRIVARTVLRLTYRGLSDWAEYKVRPEDVLAGDSFVLPSYRGRRAIVRLKAFAARDLLQQGYRRLISSVKLRNASSLQSQRHVGGVPILTVRRYQAFGLMAISTDRHWRIGRYGPHRRFQFDCT